MCRSIFKINLQRIVFFEEIHNGKFELWFYHIWRAQKKKKKYITNNIFFYRTSFLRNCEISRRKHFEKWKEFCRICKVTLLSLRWFHFTRVQAVQAGKHFAFQSMVVRVLQDLHECGILQDWMIESIESIESSESRSELINEIVNKKCWGCWVNVY